MLMKHKTTFAIVLLLPLVCLAADGLKPLDVKLGLWEASITSQSTGTPPIPEDLLARLTPEQRAKMEAALAARQGRGPQTRVHRSCLTSDDLREMLDLDNGNLAACKRTVIRSSSTEEEVHFECDNGRTKRSGDVHAVALSPESVKGTSQVSFGDGTHTMDVKFSFTSRWLGAACGDLKKN